MANRIFVAIMLLTTTDVLSCSCFFSFERRHLDEISQKSDVIFLGKVTEVLFNADSSIVDTKFYVKDKIKGALNLELVSRQETKDGCGAAYQTGKTYLIAGYSTSARDVITSNACRSWSNEATGIIYNLDEANFERLIGELKKRNR